MLCRCFYRPMGRTCRKGTSAWPCIASLAMPSRNVVAATSAGAEAGALVLQPSCAGASHSPAQPQKRYLASLQAGRQMNFFARGQRKRPLRALQTLLSRQADAHRHNCRQCECIPVLSVPTAPLTKLAFRTSPHPVPSQVIEPCVTPRIPASAVLGAAELRENSQLFCCATRLDALAYGNVGLPLKLSA